MPDALQFFVDLGEQLSADCIGSRDLVGNFGDTVHPAHTTELAQLDRVLYTSTQRLQIGSIRRTMEHIRSTKDMQKPVMRILLTGVDDVIGGTHDISLRNEPMMGI